MEGWFPKLENQETETWLQEILGDKCDCSKCEEFACKVLDEIRMRNLQGEVVVREKLIPNVVKTAEYYKEQCKQMAEIEKCAISRSPALNSLIDRDVGLQTLANVGAQLDLDEGSQARLVSAIVKLKLDNEMGGERKFKNILPGELRDMSQKSTRLEKVAMMLESKFLTGQAKNESSSTIFMKAKCDQYRKEIAKSNDKLSATKTKEISMETLTGEYARLKELKSELQSAKQELDEFYNLPQDHCLARLKVAEAQKLLEQLEGEAEKKIGDRLRQ